MSRHYFSQIGPCVTVIRRLMRIELWPLNERKVHRFLRTSVRSRDLFE